MSAPQFHGEQACAAPDVDPEWFFPPENGRGGDGPAKAVCKRCPVERACFEFALPRVWIEGIWGATTSHERRQIRKQLRTGAVHPPRNEPAGHRPNKAAS